MRRWRAPGWKASSTPVRQVRPPAAASLSKSILQSALHAFVLPRGEPRLPAQCQRKRCLPTDCAGCPFFEIVKISSCLRIAMFKLPALLTYAGPSEAATAATDPFGGALGMQAADFGPQGADGEDQGALHLHTPQPSMRQEPPAAINLCYPECICDWAAGLLHIKAYWHRGIMHMLTAQSKHKWMARLMSCTGPASDNPWASFDDGPEAGSGASSTLQQPAAQPGTGAPAWQGWNGSQPATSAAPPGHLEAAAASAMAVPSPEASPPAKAEPEIPEGMSPDALQTGADAIIGMPHVTEYGKSYLCESLRRVPAQGLS